MTTGAQTALTAREQYFEQRMLLDALSAHCTLLILRTFGVHRYSILETSSGAFLVNSFAPSLRNESAKDPVAFHPSIAAKPKPKKFTTQYRTTEIRKLWRAETGLSFPEQKQSITGTGAHEQWKPKFAEYRWRSEAAKYPCQLPDLHGTDEEMVRQQKEFKALFRESIDALNAEVLKFTESDKHTFDRIRRRKDGGAQGSCSRCGSELFFTPKPLRSINKTAPGWKVIQCYDCGKYSRVGLERLPFKKERQRLARLSGDSTSGELEDFGSSFIGALLLQQGNDIGFGEVHTDRTRQESRNEWPVWLNRTTVQTVLRKKFPLLRFWNGREKLPDASQKLLKSQMTRIVLTGAAVYYWAFLSWTDEKIATELRQDLGIEVHPKQLKDIRKTFLTTGEIMFAPRKEEKPLQTKMPRPGVGFPILDQLTFAEKLQFISLPVGDQKEWFSHLRREAGFPRDKFCEESKEDSAFTK